MRDYIGDYFTNPNNLHEESGTSFDLPDPEQEHKFALMKHVECGDGFTMSVQASYSHYCRPRITHLSTDFCIFEKFEVGYPSKREVLLNKYQDGDSEVYAYVPREVINEIIEKHGGLKEEHA